MKKRLFLISVLLVLTGCVAVPVYDNGYDYPGYGPYVYGYPYGYVGPDVNVFVSGGFHGGHGFHGGGRGFHGGGFHGGGGRGFHGGGGGFHGGWHRR